MTTFSDDETDKLIELITQYPALYDTQLDFYKDDKWRDNVWKIIAEGVNKSDIECRKKWKLLKDTYNRCKRKQKHRIRSRQGQWQFFDRLRFLDSVKSRTEAKEKNDNVQETPIREVVVVVPTPGTSISGQEASTSTNMEEQQKPILKRKNPGDDFIKFLKERHEQRNIEMQASTPQRTDEISSFAKHIEMSLRNLSVRSRAMAKNEIFNIITKYEMADIDGQNESPYSTSMNSYASYSPISTTSFKAEQHTDSDMIEFSSQ